MHRFLPALLALLAVFGFSACGGKDTHEALAKESVSTFQEFGDTLAKVTDKASAEKHGKDLEKLSAKVKDLKARMEKLGEPSEKQAEEMMKKLEGEMTAAMQKMNTEAGRIAQDPELMKIIGPVLEKMGE